MKATKVNVSNDLDWVSFQQHRSVSYKEVVSAAEANALGVHLSAVLWEKIEVGGAVLPHYHDVAEVIHITKGNVRLLCNGVWTSYQAGDTFLVPAGVVHSVQNNDTVPTEQVSIFLPLAAAEEAANSFFASHLVPDPTEA